MGEYVGQFISDYAIQVGVALVVLTATAVWLISRRPRYVKSADYMRGIEVLRLEFRRSIDEARAATTKKATAVGDKLLSVPKSHTQLAGPRPMHREGDARRHVAL